MKYLDIKLNCVLIFCCAAFALDAQSVLSITSRGDLAMAYGAVSSGVFVAVNKPVVGLRSSFGLEIALDVDEHQAAIIGAEYARSGFDYEVKVFTAISNIDPVSEIAYNEDIVTGVQRYEFIAFPIGYRRYSRRGNWNLYGQASMIPMIYLQTYDYLAIADLPFVDTRERSHLVQEVNLAASVAIGIERTVFKNWVIGLQPTYRIHVTSVSNTSRKEWPWTAGLQLNVGRTLEKKGE